MSRRRAWAGVAALAAALVLYGAAPPATAAPYIAVACAESAGLLTLNHHVFRFADGWVADGIAAPGGDSCHEGREGRGLYAVSGGAFSGYRFDAPPGTTLTEAWTYAWSWLPAAVAGARPAFIAEAWQHDQWMAMPPGRNGLEWTSIEQSGWGHAELGRAAALRVGVGCRPQPCTGTLPPRAEVRTVSVGIDDPEPPVLDPLEGSLLAGGPRQGTHPLRFGAADRESGVASLRVTFGGREVGAWRGDGRCRRLSYLLVAGVPHYDARVPCPPDAERTTLVDTAALPDGPHDLSVRAEDAAGNDETAAARVVLDNHPPGAGAVRLRGQAGLGERLEAEMSGFAGQEPRMAFVWQRCTVNGEICTDVGSEREYVVGPADAGRRLRARVTATDGGGSASALSALSDVVPSPAPAVAPQPAPAAPQPAPAPAAAPPLTIIAPAGVVGRERLNAWLDGPGGATRTLRVRRGTRVRIRGRLTDASGRPVAGAAIGLVEYLHGVPRPASGATTRRDGRFTTFTRLGPGRTLRFTHRGAGGIVHSPILRLVLRR